MTGARYLREMTSGVAVVVTPAEVDITNAGQLRAVLVEAASGRPPVVVVDMTRTRFCDAAGVHVLLAAHRRARAAGGELRLALPAGGAVLRVIRLICLSHLIPCFASVGTALARAPAATQPH